MIPEATDNMESPLLSTKLFIPPLRPGWVSRPRLLEKMRAVLNNSLSLVSAPAGFGKTTLVSAWIQYTRPPAHVAWLSLEEADNEPMRFWGYVIAALNTLYPSAGQSSLKLLHSSPSVPPESMLTVLINELSSIAEDFALVLDDYHFIQTPAIHQGLSFILEHLPSKMHLVIATRVDPPLPLVHLRGRGTLIEIRADDLRFTAQEAAELFKELNAPDIPVENIESLNTRTEGWVVGLKMALLSLRDQRDVSAFVTDFTGSQRYVMDYLMEEVLSRQTPDMSAFLLQTSILERLSGPLCDALTQRNDGRETLLKLEKDNLFVVPLDDSRQWYRYEHLFADLLCHRLELEKGKEAAKELHLKASRWYEVNGLVESAIHHALAAQEWSHAVELIVAARPATHDGYLSVYNWLRPIPREVLLVSPLACDTYAWALATTGHHREALAFLDWLEKERPDSLPILCTAAVVRTYMGTMQLDPRTEEYARQALALLTSNDIATRAEVCQCLGSYFWSQRRYNDAEPLLKESYELRKQMGGDISTPLAKLAELMLFRGKLYQAAELFSESIRTAELNPDPAGAHMLLGMVYYWWNDLIAASAELEQAAALKSGNLSTLEWLHLFGVWVRLAQGDLEGATDSLEKAEQLFTNKEPMPMQIARLAGHHLALAIARDDPTLIEHWLAKFCQYVDLVPFDVPNFVMHLVHQSRGPGLSQRLGSEYERWSREGLGMLQIVVRIEQALASKTPDEALSFLGDALKLAKPEGNIRSFADFGMLLAPLLKQAIARGLEPGYSRKLLDVIEAEERRRRIRKGEIPQSSAARGLISERELEVLRLLDDEISDKQIAARLSVSLSTVKTHVHHILEKLEVKDRRKAVHRARDLKLI
jgi:LuxR family maltose regulon positive regulatory protein